MAEEMALKIRFPSAEELEFCSQVNALLAQYGARISAYEIQHPDNHTAYHVTFECGSKRRSISSDLPFHYDPPQAVVQRVLDWMDSVRVAHRWTTEVPNEFD